MLLLVTDQGVGEPDLLASKRHSDFEIRSRPATVCAEVGGGLAQHLVRQSSCSNTKSKG